MMNELSPRSTSVDDSYSTRAWTRATLAIYPGDMDPEKVTQKLGLAPTSSQGKGEYEVFTPAGERMVYSSSWLLSSEGEVLSKDLRRHLDWLLDRIEPVAAQLRELQQHPSMKMAVSCLWWSAFNEGGPTLWPEQMRRMAQLNLECGINVAFYPDDGDDNGDRDEEEPTTPDAPRAIYVATVA